MTDSSPDPQTRHRRRVAAIFVGMLLAGLFASLPLAARIYQHRRFYNSVDRIYDTIVTWNSHGPADVDPDQWRVGCEMTINALVNTCTTVDTISNAEMDRFCQAVQAKDAEPNSWEKLEWVWDRLAETSPYGRKYAEGWRPVFDELKQDPNFDNDPNQAPGL